ncbi:MAG: right-handed parallel beta-helix repeat-containing protein [Verrucomicrobia bacterium]|nr:right-handed parallel beta-helix repeat-containing protein [Verrucomicrobiota bacterium]
MLPKCFLLLLVSGFCFSATLLAGSGTQPDFAPKADEQQLPRAMRSRMRVSPHIRVGRADADIIGSDNRALQGAIDYVAGLGGGVVDIGPGEYEMHDALHLRSFVTVRGTKGRTVLRMAKGASSALAIDGDYGEEQITVVNPDGFAVGCGVTVWDDHAGGFHRTVGRIIGRNGNTFAIDTPLNADCMVHDHALAAIVFPVVSGCNIQGARLEDVIVEGNKQQNVHTDGCRAAGIYLYRGFGTVIANCVVRDYNGDGISFQQSNDVQLLGCVSEDNATLGIHPGSGSQRAVVRECVARRNGADGLYLCWRVRHGLFEGNRLEDNGRYGISIGHKDSDNLIADNQVLSNREEGVYFREETAGMAGHRNRLEKNRIENNGEAGGVAGIRVRGQTANLVFKDNIIRDTRPAGQQRQTIGIRIEADAGPVDLEGNSIQAQTQIEDQRR